MNLYEILGVGPTATADAIKEAVRRRSRETHPDLPGGDRESFEAVMRARDILTNPARRARYDETGDADVPPGASMHEKAIRILSEIIADMLKVEHAERIDLAKTLVEAVVLRKSHERKLLASRRGVLRRFERVMKRFKRKAGGIDVLAIVHQREKAGMLKLIEESEDTLDVLDHAHDLVKDYTFEPDVFMALSSFPREKSA